MSVPHEAPARLAHIKRGEHLVTLAALFATGIFSVLFSRDALRVLLDARPVSLLSLAGYGMFVLATLVLLYGNVAYLLTRRGALIRARQHRPDAEDAVNRCYRGAAPTLAVLVPSYKESVAVVRRTLLSAALQDYPHKQVVLLIDDPPQPADAESAALLAAMRALPYEIGRQLAEIAETMAFEQRAWQRRRPFADGSAELVRLSALHRRAAAWLEAEADKHPVSNHEERYFVQAVLREPAGEHRRQAERLEALAKGAVASRAQLDAGYRRLAGLFSANLCAFERKRFVNLSHEPNKAMNLNSYLGLMGGAFDEERGVGGTYMVPSAVGRLFADAEFIITLDADSLIRRDYAPRLVDFMRTPGNERVAVVQTPYSAYPGATRPLEYIAGATTDVQYFVHQGFTAHNATYWVGANALLRKAALEDIATSGTERGHLVRRFIQDNTVIEDTESSVDLLLHGWTLHNYPERLAHSATPPDFGSLIIQRRRWANGGLLILPKLLRYLGQRTPVPQRLAHGITGIHYLVSPAAVNIAVLMLLFIPVEEMVASPWLPLAALPYMLAYGRDLVRAGYRFADIVGVYALNMLLVPVNLAGVGRSLIQAATGRKSPFGRTPKVADHTATPPTYLVAIAALLLGSVAMLLADVVAGRALHGIFAALNLALLGFGFQRFIGLRQALTDLAELWQPRDRPAPARPGPEVATVPGMPPTGGDTAKVPAEAP